jgi:hypothetical protein
MNLWQRLEIRSREECNLDDTWYLYSADLDVCGYGYAHIKMAQKNDKKFITEKDYRGSIYYLDIQ